jgi:restriction system protein
MDDATGHWYTIQQQQQQQQLGNLNFNFPGFRLNGQGQVDELPIIEAPPILLQALLTFGERVPEGQVVTAAALPWFEAIRLAQGDPNLMHKLGWREWEAIIAGAYRRAGFEVILTPRSNDKGRDVIATRHDVGSIRYYDQVKAYSPGTAVTLEEVLSMLGVLTAEPNVSKAIITTTSTFAPGVFTHPGITQFLPYRLDLRDREKLLPWLAEIATTGADAK